uniref:Ribonuclease P protein subunit p30 n=1 Tax=Aotus nancymaae TaxID=37293 RepID=A0A2K5BXD8_AOTNA
MAVFADLDLRAGSDMKALRGLVETAAHLGYSVVAVNHVVDFKEKKQEIEKPVAVSELFTTLPIVQGKSRPIKILTRLTIIVSDPSHCNVLRATSSRVRLYDVVAVFPKTEKLFHIACTHLDVDLVCITVTEKLPFYFKRPPINVEAEESLLIYSPITSKRRIQFSNASYLMQICKEDEIRGPYDVANLGLLFGLSESDAKTAVSTNCRAALLHGETRKTAFGIISTVKKPRLSEGDEDCLPAPKKAKWSCFVAQAGVQWHNHSSLEPQFLFCFKGTRIQERQLWISHQCIHTPKNRL